LVPSIFTAAFVTFDGDGVMFDGVNRPFVEELHIQNFGCIRDATFKLSPLHALIGPNDSGKSTALRALRVLSDFAAQWNPNAARDVGAYAQRGELYIDATIGSSRPYLGRHGNGTWNARQGDEGARKALLGSQLLRLEPDALRKSSQLIAEGQSLRLLDEHGAGLPAVYDAIITRDVNAYIAISKRLAELFPSVKSLNLKNPNQATKALGVQLHDGTVIPADTMSEGLLYWLAYAALPYLEPTALLLIEEPENGLHPARIRDVMKVLREISQTIQVVLATHSPLVINELEPHEVSVVTRGADGTKAVLMKDTPNFAERSKAYSLGELWVSYANGEDEKPLLEGGPRP
jgi:ABC-type branched-subunit amino acid transport system ATPase component